MSSKGLKPIRVLQMIASFTRGGSQSVVMNLYRNIDRKKVQFDFIVDHTEYSGYEDEIKELGGKIFVMPTFNGTNIIEVKKAWNNFFKDHQEYKILHSHSRSYASIYLPIAKKYGVKTIIHSHSTSNGSGIKSKIKDLMQLPLRHQADYYMACSLDAGKWLFGNKVVNSNRFFILNNAIDAKKYTYNKSVRKEYRKEFGIKDDECIFIQISNFIPIKNHSFSLNCFKDVLSIKPNSKFFIIGSGDENNTNNIKNIIKENNIENEVLMLGTRNDVNNLLQMADCYLMPSIYEGISLAAIEAQASGIKCLLSDKVSKDEQITNECKFLPLEKNIWVKEMTNISLERKNNYDTIVNAGYDINTTAKWIEDFYLETYDK